MKVNSYKLISLPISTISKASLMDMVSAHIHEEGKSAMRILACNVHMLMEAFDDDTVRRKLETSEIIVPDGAPVAWVLRSIGIRVARIRGPELMVDLLKRGATSGWKFGLLGGSSKTLDKLVEVLRERYPFILIEFAESPPFRPLSGSEDAEICDRIIQSKVDVLFVGLGCPKQELWMARNSSHLSCVLVGTGAAFDFIAGEKAESPVSFQVLGLEWLFRLICEPRRLLMRYVKHNPRFIVLAAIKILRERSRKIFT